MIGYPITILPALESDLLQGHVKLGGDVMENQIWGGVWDVA